MVVGSNRFTNSLYSNLITSPFGRLVEGRSSQGVFDAIYIPTNGLTPLPEQTIDRITKYSRRVVFLLSNSIPKWIIGLDRKIPNVGYIQVLQNEYFSSYITRPENGNISISMRPDFDIPVKRSYALYEAKREGFQTIGMVDDDILLKDSHFCNALYAIEKGARAVGTHISDYPDKSTLDHIKRELTGNRGSIFMTGSAMFLSVDEVDGDFPLVYNEDLLFFLQQQDLSKVVSCGIAHQREKLDWTKGQRVMHEQFGEIVFNSIARMMFRDKHSLIDWARELDDAKREVAILVGLDASRHYHAILRDALAAIEMITVEELVKFVDRISFSPKIAECL